MAANRKTYVLVNGQVRTIKAGLDADVAINALRLKGYTVDKIGKPPSIKTMEKWMNDGIAKATDGCKVEPDGECPHGHKSWLMHMSII